MEKKEEIYNQNNNNTNIPTKTPTIKLKHNFTKYTKNTTTDPPTKTNKILIEITVIRATTPLREELWINTEFGKIDELETINGYGNEWYRIWMKLKMNWDVVNSRNKATHNQSC